MAKKKDSNVWVHDASLLVKVEKKRSSIKVKGKDGKVKGGTEYYGIKA